MQSINIQYKCWYRSSILATQAMTLDTIFHSLASRASEQTNLKHYDSFLKLALKAQAQSRCAMEAISKIKNPPNATFVKQTNYAQGPQQVNNYNSSASEHDTTTHKAAKTDTRTSETENETNELLEMNNGKRLDFGAKAEASGDDQGMEALEAINGTEDRKRKKSIER